MSYKEGRLSQECDTLNRVFAAFFMNQCYIKDGINFIDSKPQMPNIASLNDSGRFFVEGDNVAGLKEFFHGKVVIEKIDLEKFREVGISDFFEGEIQGQIMGVASHFAAVVKQNQYCDFVFSDLPDASPFIFDCILDPKTNFKSRLIIAHDMMTGNHNAIWEFNCLLVSKFREVEEHPIYGKSYKDVDYMTDEEREKFNKPPTEDEIDG
jgi:hypothetical protein